MPSTGPHRPSITHRGVRSGRRGYATAIAVICSAVLSLTPRQASAQAEVAPRRESVMARGTVLLGSGQPAAGASVVIADAAGRGQAAIADQRGGFAISLPGPGRYSLQIRAVGYLPIGTMLEVRDGDATRRFTLHPAQVLQSVQVIGAAAASRDPHPGASELAGSVSVLSGEQISREQVSFSQELLRKVPGVYRAEFGQGIVAGDIGIRGFNSESEIASTKLLIDGIPSNLNSGVSEMSALFPLEIGRIDVVRGTNDPRFGLFNLAGNISVETPRGGSYMTTRLQAGSFGASEGQLLAAFALGGFSQTLFAGLRSSDGYRDHATLDKWSVSGKWFYRTSGQRVSIGAIGRAHRLYADAPGYLTFAQSRSTPTVSPAFSGADGGSVATDHGSLHLEVAQTTTFNWSLRAYAQHFDRIRFVRFTAAGAQQERIENERQQGAILGLTWKPSALAARSVTLTAGADLQQQDNVQQRFRAADRVRQATLRDYDFSLDNRGAFAQLTGSPSSRLQLMLGLRADDFDGAFRNLTTNASQPILGYRWIAQPKTSATFRVTDRLSTYANYGRAFQIGAGVASYGSAPLQPSRNDGIEAGFVSTPITAISLRAGVWQQTATDEVRLKFDNSGDSENIGQTRRTGIDVETTVRVHRTFSLWAAGTSQRAVLVEPGLANASSKGKLLNHVPAWTAKVGGDWSPRTGVHLSAWSYLQGSYQITPQNDRGTWGDQRTINADISWRWRAAALGLGVTNLLDRYNEYAWWDGAQTLHSPAAPRSVFLTLTIDR